MSDIVVMTDTNSGMTREEGEKYGVAVLPMSFIINGKVYYEGIDISHEEFFQKLEQGAEVSTSQPAPGEVLDMWDSLLKKHDEIVYIPMSSSLSKSYETAVMLSRDYDGRVRVVDNRRVSTPQKQTVMDALELAKQGKTGAQIKEILDADALKSSTYIAVDTLKYLKKGGRITGAAALLGTVLDMKPILVMHGGKLDAHGKIRGMKSARRAMIAAIRKEIEENYQEDLAKGDIGLQMAYSSMNKETVADWEKQIREEFPELSLHSDRLSLSLSCHIGPGGLGIAVGRIINKDW